MILTPSPRVQMIPVDDLRLWDANPRRIEDEMMGGLKRSLADEPGMLLARPLLARTDATLIGGNHRLQAIREMLAESDEDPRWDALVEFVARAGGVPTFVIEVDDARATRLAILDNQGFARWEQIGLATFLADQDDHGALGFSDAESEKLANLLEQGPDDETLGEIDDTSGPEQEVAHRVSLTFTDRHERDQVAEEMVDRGYAVSTASGAWLDEYGQHD